MILGIYLALCIQGPQRACQPGLAIFKATHGLDTQAKPLRTASLRTELLLSLGSDTETVATLRVCMNTPTTHKHPQTSAYMLKGKSHIKTSGPKHPFVYIS